MRPLSALLLSLLFFSSTTTSAGTGEPASVEKTVKYPPAPGGWGLQPGIPQQAPQQSLSCPIVGHGDQKAGRGERYNIWQENCHNAADAFVNAASDRSGVLVCGGDPVKSPQHHTANWILFDDSWSCIYNWGDRCCWKGAANPPDISSGDGQGCAKWACGPQYRGASEPEPTRVMPTGKLVEDAGAMVCVRTAALGRAYGTPGPDANYSASKKPACLTCCAERADGWRVDPGARDKAQSDARRESFRSKCSAACSGFLNGR